MKMFRVLGFALLAVFLTFGSAYADNVYNDGLTSEDTSGNWTFSGTMSGQKVALTVIDAPSATTGTVTTAKSGSTFVLRGQTGPVVTGVGYTFALPTAASGLEYTFTTATNQTISVKAASGDRISLGAASTTRITSAASTGTTVTLVGNTGVWYVQAMSYGQNGDNTWAVAAT